MSTTVKVLLSVLGAGLLLVAGLVVAFVWWVDSNKESFARARKETIAEAKAFASEHDDAGCLDFTMTRIDACEDVDVMCQAHARVFLDACLEHSARTDGFCDGVPRSDAILETASYRISKCSALGREGDGPCGRLLTAVQSHCDLIRGAR